MKNLLKNRKVVITALVVILAFFAYTYFFKPDTSDSVLISSTDATGGLAQGREIIALLTDLKSLKLDESIFQDPVFRSLEDFTLPIDPEPQGRTNPFAPLGTDPVVPIEAP